MVKYFESIIHALINPTRERPFPICDAYKQFDTEPENDYGIARSLNAAFLIALTKGIHPESDLAKQFLVRMAGSQQWTGLARFYLKGIELIHGEIKGRCRFDDDFADRLVDLFDWISNKKGMYNIGEAIEKVWALFFPEATGILANRKEQVKALRAKRTVTIKKLNPKPITDPTRQILFTSNMLLTIPPVSKSLDSLSISDRLKEKLVDILREEQIYWYDHPIQVGMEPEKNEVLYGLKGLEKAFQFERDRGNVPEGERLTCLLSASVTHQSLDEIVKHYLEEIFEQSDGLKDIDLYLVTERDSRQIMEEIISPAMERYLQRNDSRDLLEVFGVDGEYGRHYSFLKAISAFWNIFFQPEIKATFKIDLDQVFPQEALVKQTGLSAFEHFKTELWGAKGLDSMGQPLELGMIAGSLVNEEDIERSLFTPDVRFPDSELSADEYIFFSILPQALSTEAEMMTRYTNRWLDGEKRCIERIHVTGGTNGILVDSLRRYRPFTPSFMGRAEDQAYILSVMFNREERLAYVHKDGLIMRHDKKSFAQDAIQSAYIPKLIGDYVRILYFSAYSEALTGDVAVVKDIVNPFTGCFISKIPISVVFLRFSLKAASFFSAGKEAQGLEFLEIGSKRIINALKFVNGKDSELKKQYEKERIAWNLYYDVLLSVEEGLKKYDGFALDLKEKAIGIINQWAVRTQ